MSLALEVFIRSPHLFTQAESFGGIKSLERWRQGKVTWFSDQISV